MRQSFESKVLKEKKLDKDTKVKISKNEPRGRIFVEFSTADGRFVVQKNFADTIEGREQMKEFQNSIKNGKDLKKYLGLEK